MRVLAAVVAVMCGLLLFAYVDTGEMVFLGGALFCGLAIGCCLSELRVGESSDSSEERRW